MCIDKKCLERHEAFVPGKYFFAENGCGLETMRLNFTMFNEEILTKAVGTVGEVLTEFIAG
jgi:DNA-binding transcriptional MocR family regulator